MSNKRELTLHYLKAITADSNEFAIDSYIKELLLSKPSVKERSVAKKEKKYSCNDFRKTDDYVLLAISITTPGEHANALQSDSSLNSVESTLLAAPKGLDFEDGQIFALIHAHHVIVCPVKLRAVHFESFLYELFKNTDIEDFKLMPTITKDAIKLISKGVKEIELNTAINAAELMHNKENNIIATSLRNPFCGNEISLSDAKANKDSHVLVKLSLKNSGKIDLQSITQNKLIETSRYLMEQDDENFKIITNGGAVINGSELKLTKKVKFNSNGKMIFKEEAWKALTDMKTELEKEGYI